MRFGNPRVGFVSLHDPADRAALSGMPHAMFAALRRTGLDLVDLGRLDGIADEGFGGLRRKALAIVERIDRLRARLGDDEAARWRRSSRAMARRFESKCRRRAARLAAAIDRLRPDVLFGNCISSPLAFLDRDVPIVYSGDATAEIISSTYPRFAALGPGYAAVTDRIERRALSRVRFAAFASPRTRESAIARYGVMPERCLIAGYGANLDPRVGVEAGTSEPSPRSLVLTITAADPVRKQVLLAIECVRTLRDRGWNASIDVIGPRPRGGPQEQWIRWAGRLDHAVPDQVVQHARILATSHLCLLPSTGEAYGIAPIESAMFGRPAVVTDVGGLSFVVRDGESGRVVPRDAGARELADAVESIVTDRRVYARLAASARGRAEAELNWDAWARVVAGLVRIAHRERSNSNR